MVIVAAAKIKSFRDWQAFERWLRANHDCETELWLKIHNIDAAKADGRWDAAYAPIRQATHATVPADLRAAIEAKSLHW